MCFLYHQMYSDLLLHNFHRHRIHRLRQILLIRYNRRSSLQNCPEVPVSVQGRHNSDQHHTHHCRYSRLLHRSRLPISQLQCPVLLPVLSYIIAIFIIFAIAGIVTILVVAAIPVLGCDLHFLCLKCHSL